MLDRLIFTAEALICIIGVLLVALSPLFVVEIYRNIAFKRCEYTREDFDRIDRRSYWIMGIWIFLVLAFFCFCLAPV